MDDAASSEAYRNSEWKSLNCGLVPTNSTTRRPPHSLPNTEIVVGGNDCHPTWAWMLPGSSVRPSGMFALATHHQVQFFPPAPASAPILERLLPTTRLLFLAGMHHGVRRWPLSLERDFFFSLSL